MIAIVESLQSTAPRALRALLDRQPTTPAKVTFAWQIAAGVTLGRATTPRWSDDGVLHVTARSAAWRREIDRARPTIAARLKELLGPGVVRAIVLDGPDDDKPAARRGMRRPVEP